MNTKSSASALRGTKWTCSNGDCGRNFYDLNAAQAVCPYCETAYVAPLPRPESTAYRPARPKVYKLQQEAPREDDALAAADIPVIDADEEDDKTADDAVEEFEVEEDDPIVVPDDESSD